MDLGKFRKAPQGPYAFEYWESTVHIPSPLGPFSIELRPKAGQTPDARMIEEARDLADYLSHNGNEVAEKVFEHYQRCAEHPAWLRECGVPESLGATDLGKYIEARNLVVSYEEHPTGPWYEKVIFVDPLWDTEHKIVLAIQDGRLEFCE